jgi:formiminoglutamase
MAKLTVYSKEKIDSLFNARANEEKWGQHIQHIVHANAWQEELQQSKANYVILGLPEDIGIRANMGIAGAAETFGYAIKSILNIQHNKFQDASKVLLLGHIDFSEEHKRAENADVNTLRTIVSEIDEAIAPIVQSIIASGKKLIAIGGGHNNAYPILKGSYMAIGSALNCINIDAHTDYRIAEGRHSGNGFRYAKTDGYLHKYGVFGLHENYNSELVLNDIENEADIQYISFEDIAIRKRIPLELALNSIIIFLQNEACGIEIDLDAISDMPSSAQTKSGWTATEARAILHQSSTLLSSVYLHITEGSAGLANETEKNSLAKYISYLVSDYIKSSAY